FRYNLALSLVRSNEHTRAVPILLSLVTRLSKEDWLYARSLFLLGWTKDQISKGQDSSVESFYSRALSADPAFDKAHLALAIFKFRKAGLRNSESDFKTFIDLAPDLDPPARVRNYNVMNDDDFYSYARAQIRELNVPGGIVGGKPSSLVMAVDAILSCLQDRVGEARKILEGAIGASPGDIHVIKAIGYQRWKEGQIEDMTDLLKELPGAKTSFAVNLMLGKAFLKVGHLELAKNAFMNITDTYPNRSEGYSHLGDVFSRMKQYATSKEKYNEALRKSETDIVALRGLARRDGAFKFSKTIESLLPF
ncbi:MAG: hypothetical protein M9962_10565, partial [Oligoflexia bacterium]|nr:hypothetical protein [Oligoflexia bacterium]